MAKSLPWHVVTERRPCPVCSKLDSCMYAGTADSPTAAICTRTRGPSATADVGWLHVFRDNDPPWAPWRSTIRAAIRMMGRTVSNG